MPASLSIHGTVPQRLQCLAGIVTFILIAYVVGRIRPQRDDVDAVVARTPFPWRVVLWGVALQFIFAAIVLWLPGLLQRVNEVVNALLGFTREGARLVFGDLANGDVPVVGPDGKTPLGIAKTGAYFAFFVLPTIVFFSMLTAILYHTGIMQLVVHGLAWVMAKTMRTSGAETLSAAANIFVGQTEAPLMVRPFLALATRSELMCVMVAGFANIASGVLGLYTAWLQNYVANAGGHLAAACFVSAPAALVVSKLLVPETQTAQTFAGVSFRVERVDANVIDAATRGTAEGVSLAINVGAMLIAFTALVALINAFIGWLSVQAHIAPGGRPAHAPAHLRPRPGAAGVARRRLMAGRAGRRLAAGRQDRAERADRVQRHEGPLRRRSGVHLAEVGADRDVRPVRFCQLRLHRHPGRRHRPDGPHAPLRAFPPRPPRHAWRRTRVADDRRGGRRVGLIPRRDGPRHVPHAGAERTRAAPDFVA
jgi:nucleoside transporter